MSGLHPLGVLRVWVPQALPGAMEYRSFTPWEYKIDGGTRGQGDGRDCLAKTQSSQRKIGRSLTP